MIFKIVFNRVLLRLEAQPFSVECLQSLYRIDIAMANISSEEYPVFPCTLAVI